LQVGQHHQAAASWGRLAGLLQQLVFMSVAQLRDQRVTGPFQDQAAVVDGTAGNPALLGMDALGLISLEHAADLIRVQERLVPDPAAQQTYADLRPTFDGLYDALVPAFRTLRRMRPNLPLA
jgi:hypothetical protein